LPAFSNAEALLDQNISIGGGCDKDTNWRKTVEIKLEKEIICIIICKICK
jgi:hypothetical protein